MGLRRFATALERGAGYAVSYGTVKNFEQPGADPPVGYLLAVAAVTGANPATLMTGVAMEPPGEARRKLDAIREVLMGEPEKVIPLRTLPRAGEIPPAAETLLDLEQRLAEASSEARARRTGTGADGRPS